MGRGRRMGNQNANMFHTKAGCLLAITILAQKVSSFSGFASFGIQASILERCINAMTGIAKRGVHTAVVNEEVADSENVVMEEEMPSAEMLAEVDEG